MRVSAIYAVTRGVQVVYIGQSVNVHTRIYGHIRLLEKGKHSNKYLQRIHDKHQDLVFTIIDEVPVEHLTEMERYWMNMCLPTTNLVPAGGFGSSKEFREYLSKKFKGRPNPSARRKPSKETIEKRTKTRIEKYGRYSTVVAAPRKCVERVKRIAKQKEKLPATIRKLSPEAIAKRTASRLAKYSGKYMSKTRKEPTRTRTKRGTPEHIALLRQSHLGKPNLATRGKKLSPEAIAKRTATRRANGGYIVSEERRLKMSASAKGKPNKGHFKKGHSIGKGRIVSVEERKQMSLRALGKKPSAETLIKRSEGLKKAWARRLSEGYKPSPEIVQKVIATRKANGNYVWSAESKAKLSEFHRLKRLKKLENSHTQKY